LPMQVRTATGEARSSGWRRVPHPDHALLLLVVEDFPEEDALVLAVVPEGVAVVIMGGDFEAHVADRVKGKHRVVEVEKIGMVLVDEIKRPVVELLAIGGVGHAAALARVPVPYEFSRLVVLRIEVLGSSPSTTGPHRLPCQLAVIGTPARGPVLSEPCAGS